MRRSSAAVLWPLLAVAIVSALPGCTTVRQTGTERSSIEQRLLVRALERAVAQFDTVSLGQRPIEVRVQGLTTDQNFAQDFVATRLALRGVKVVRPGEVPEMVLRIFATALAVDNDSTLLGIPTMVVPVLGFPIPEIAIFKTERSRGHAEVQLFLYDDDGHFVGALPDAFGQSRYNRYTVLIIFSFSVGDLGKPGHHEE
jgi:hypothetical protein